MKKEKKYTILPTLRLNCNKISKSELVKKIIKIYENEVLKIKTIQIIL